MGKKCKKLPKHDFGTLAAQYGESVGMGNKKWKDYSSFDKASTIGSMGLNAAGSIVGAVGGIMKASDSNPDRFDKSDANANIATNIGSNAASFGAMGASIGGPIGAGVGALVGAGVGLFTANKQNRMMRRDQRIKDTKMSIGRASDMIGDSYASTDVVSSKNLGIPGMDKGVYKFYSNSTSKPNAMIASEEAVVSPDGNVDIVPGKYNKSNPDTTYASLADGTSILPKNSMFRLPYGKSTPADIAKKISSIQKKGDEVLSKFNTSFIDRNTATINKKNTNVALDTLSIYSENIKNSIASNQNSGLPKYDKSLFRSNSGAPFAKQSNDEEQVNEAAMSVMMKSKIALASQFGSKENIANRMTGANIDRYTFTEEDAAKAKAAGEADINPGDYGTIRAASYGRSVMPSVLMLNDGQMVYDPFAGKNSPELAARQGINFDSEGDARYFAENYKKVAPAFNNNGEFSSTKSTPKFTVNGASTSGYLDNGRIKKDISIGFPNIKFPNIKINQNDILKSTALGMSVAGALSQNANATPDVVSANRFIPYTARYKSDLYNQLRDIQAKENIARYNNRVIGGTGGNAYALNAATQANSNLAYLNAYSNNQKAINSIDNMNRQELARIYNLNMSERAKARDINMRNQAAARNIKYASMMDIAKTIYPRLTQTQQ